MTFEQAKKHLESEIEPDGGLYSLGWYLAWSPGDSHITLDGDFDIEDLEALVVYIRGVKS